MAHKVQTRASISAKRFMIYAAAGAAATSLVGTDAADAAITTLNFDLLLEDTLEGDGLGQGTRIIGGDTSSFFIDFFHSVGATTPATGFALGGQVFAFDSAVDPGQVSLAGLILGNYNYASNLAAGANLSTLTDWLPAGVVGTMAFNSGFTSSQFLDPGPAFLGFRFDTGAGFVFGWASVTMNGNPLNSFTLNDVAFASVGEAIAVGQVTAIPEPGSLAALAVGAAGVTAWRRKRKAA